ncbi:hypothetical protein [Thermaurantiacus sp.]
MALAAAPLAAQAQDPLAREVTEILTQPGRDLGVVPTRVPAYLEQLMANPYDRQGTGSCKELRTGIERLTAIIGPDWGDPLPAGESREQALAKAGLRAGVSSVIPLRGVVREATGAAAAERRRQAAIEAAIARRGFLRGIATARRCRL